MMELEPVWHGALWRSFPLPVVRHEIAERPAYARHLETFPTTWTPRKPLQARGLWAWRTLGKMLEDGVIEQRQVKTKACGRPRFEYRRIAA
jgi:hypothetical protein